MELTADNKAHEEEMDEIKKSAAEADCTLCPIKPYR